MQDVHFVPISMLGECLVDVYRMDHDELRRSITEKYCKEQGKLRTPK